MSKFLQRFLDETYYSQPLFLLPFLLSLIFLYKWLNTSKGKNPPPSPPRQPVLGNLLQLGKPLHRSLWFLSEKYGELMLLRLGSKPTLVVSSASAAQEIMKTHDVVFSNRPKSTTANKLLYNGRDLVFANYGEYWRQMKSICVVHLLSNTRVRSFRAIREEETVSMVQRIMRLVPSVVNLTEIFATLVNDVVCQAAFRRKYSEDGGSNFMVLLNTLGELLGAFAVGDLIPWLGWVDRMNGLEEKLSQLAKKLDAFLEGVIEDHLCSSNYGSDEPDTREKEKDFVHVLLEVQRDSTINFPIDRECIKALILTHELPWVGEGDFRLCRTLTYPMNLINMFAGGTDTASTVLEWAMSELLRHPRALKKLQEEVRSIIQHKGSVREPDLEKMEYLQAVIKETLRLHPPSPVLPLESTKDVKVNGYDIAARTQVIINAWAIQRDPSFWEEPTKFRPERFLNSTVDYKGQDFHFIPFGAGRRICPGIAFATIIVELALANFVYAFDWALPGEAHGETLDMNESDGVVAHRRHPLLAAATPYFVT
ncbi:hypothetical protein Cgig2_033182 [Carnegiea gigantea]|uniref:Cytochrome P450 n=1 Tax=Carnegiea gigantea TaxID=171969 RepID=A0A9Q1Q7V8_9CARY|nr:hypothetical protein Cgig2_033182 [Carnegiea gigantea]